MSYGDNLILMGAFGLFLVLLAFSISRFQNRHKKHEG